MTFTQILLILRARWRLAIYIAGGIVLATVLLSLIWPSQYTGKSSVVVDFKTDPVAGSSDGGGGGAAGIPPATYVTTQADIIGSERVAERVVKLVGLDKLPEYQRLKEKEPDTDVVQVIADRIINKKLTVAPAHDSPTHGSNVIEIAVKWNDAKLAAALANAFARVAIDTNIELKVEPAKLYAAWFDKRSRELHADLEVKQKALSDYQTAHGIVATDEKLDVENARLTELSTQLVNIQTERQESQSRSHSGTDITSVPEVLQSPVVQSLKAALAQSEAKLPDIAERLGKNHPDYQAVEAEIANLHKRIQQESASIVSSLGNTNQINMRRENDARAALEAQKKRVLEFKHQHDEASVLESDVTNAQRDLDEVSKRLAQSSLESLMQQTNVVQLTTAEVPREPSSPILILNVLLSIFLGGVIGIGTVIGMELKDRRVRETDDLATLLGVPVLGVIRPVLPGAKNFALLAHRPSS